MGSIRILNSAGAGFRFCKAAGKRIVVHPLQGVGAEIQRIKNSLDPSGVEASVPGFNMQLSDRIVQLAERILHFFNMLPIFRGNIRGDRPSVEGEIHSVVVVCRAPGEKTHE